MKDLTLVIMAAGMGSRFGGLKQIEPVGPNGEIIADFSVYDAIRAGFTKVIFIIRKENYDYFKENISKKYEDKIKVEFAFQELDMVPDDVKIPENRVKMLGTGHAIYCAEDLIDGDFVVCNADDFYGFEAFKMASDFFKENNNPNELLSINFEYAKTASKNGAVKRGVVKVENGNIIESIECEIDTMGGKVIATPLKDGEPFEIDENAPVSMNFFCLRKVFIDVLNEEFAKFIHGNIDLKNEFLLPYIIDYGIKNNRFILKSAVSHGDWMGITYHEDLEEVKENIRTLIKDGVYPDKLWN